MKPGLDAYAHLDSPIHRWEPRYKLVALFALILAFSFVQHLVLLPVMVLSTFLLYKISKLPLPFLLNRLRYPGFFLATIALILPFSVGRDVIFQVGIVAVRREGIEALLLVVTRFICILSVGLILFGTAPFVTNIKAMRSLGLPPLLADMTLLSYRYIEQFAEDLTKMKRAMQLRGFRANKLSLRNLNVLASLAGTLLVRSYEQSEQVYKAMTLRGYGQVNLRRNQLFKASTRDVIASGLVFVIVAGLVAAEIILVSL